jgi:YD repeat-containing protein
MVAIPVQTESYKNNVLLSRQRTLFTEPKTNFIAPQTIQTSKGSSALEDRITFHSYHSSGNVKEVSKKDGTHIVYIWGYNDTQPIAKIENATFADIPTSVYNAIISASNTDANSPSTTNENNLRTELAKLRNTSTCPNLSNAQITTFTYDLLIGVTSTTDPRGRTAYYLYDDYGRLQYVRDHDNKILTKNEYNYKN